MASRVPVLGWYRWSGDPAEKMKSLHKKDEEEKQGKKYFGNNLLPDKDQVMGKNVTRRDSSNIYNLYGC